MSTATDLTALAAEIDGLYERATSDLGEEAAGQRVDRQHAEHVRARQA